MCINSHSRLLMFYELKAIWKREVRVRKLYQHPSGLGFSYTGMIESVEAEAESYGWEIEKQDEYDHEIADKDFIVVEIKISVDGISINEYICIRKIDDYACMIVIVASPFGSEYNDFESIAGCFTSVDE